MTDTFTKIILMCAAVLAFSAQAQEDDVKAGVAISISQQEEIWTGQQVTVNIDLKTTGFSFSDTHLSLPEVSGAFLMQTDSTTIKLTEQKDGVAWQVVRYPLALYPQGPGQLEIPPIPVRFSTSAGFGTAKKPFEFQTRPLQLTVKSPPGVKLGELVTTTPKFELDYHWQPESGSAKTGDAFTLNVSRRANGISAMLLPPLPVYRVEGLASYPQAADVHDRTNRGDLNGERRDAIIWVAEKPGHYEIPGIRFQWWDPDKQELRQKIVPGMKLDIQPSTGQTTTVAGSNPEPVRRYYAWVLALFAAIAGALIWFRSRAATSAGKTDTERTAFAALKSTCNSNQPGTAHAAIHAWLTHALPKDPIAVTLTGFAQHYGDAQLSTELLRLQKALVSADGSWRGASLCNALGLARQEIKLRKAVQSNVHLSPLNP